MTGFTVRSESNIIFLYYETQRHEKINVRIQTKEEAVQKTKGYIDSGIYEKLTSKNESIEELYYITANENPSFIAKIGGFYVHIFGFGNLTKEAVKKEIDNAVFTQIEELDV